jgi:hypothetical protein
MIRLPIGVAIWVVGWPFHKLGIKSVSKPMYQLSRKILP